MIFSSKDNITEKITQKAGKVNANSLSIDSRFTEEKKRNFYQNSILTQLGRDQYKETFEIIIPRFKFLVFKNAIRIALLLNLVFFPFSLGKYTVRHSHVKLMLANSCWQTQIGVCESHNNMSANCWRE